MCTHCNQRRDSVKWQTICRAPSSILVVHLKRIAPNDSEKCVCAVDISERIELKPGEHFQLHGVIVHHGTEQDGHYAALVRESDAHWAMFDDDHITDKMTAQAAHQAELRHYAYLCVYRRVTSGQGTPSVPCK